MPHSKVIIFVYSHLMAASHCALFWYWNSTSQPTPHRHSRLVESERLTSALQPTTIVSEKQQSLKSPATRSMLFIKCKDSVKSAF